MSFHIDMSIIISPSKYHGIVVVFYWMTGKVGVLPSEPFIINVSITTHWHLCFIKMLVIYIQYITIIKIIPIYYGHISCFSHSSWMQWNHQYNKMCNPLMALYLFILIFVSKSSAIIRCNSVSQCLLCLTLIIAINHSISTKNFLSTIVV